MNLTSIKAIVLTALMVVTFILTMLPLKVVTAMKRTLDPIRRRNYQRVISLLNCVGGGVFLGACLLDLFPDVQDDLIDVLEKMKIRTTFPVGEFIMVFGLFIVFIVEQAVLSFKEHHDSDETHPILYRPSASDYKTFSEVEEIHQEPTMNVQHSHSIMASSTVLTNISNQSALRSILLMFALSLHSVFEGLAIGLQSNVDELVQIFIAVIIHKSIIAFSLGLNLVQSNLKFRIIILMNTVFSITAPVGIGIGMGIVNLSHTTGPSLASTLLQGIACGTFLYVTFFEVLPHEMNNSEDRLFKVLACIVGFSVICGALFLDPTGVHSCYHPAEPAP